jgi:PAS domain S-box-containing protein
MNKTPGRENIVGEIPLYSTRISKNYYEYMRKYHPGVDMGPILEYAGIAFHQIEDEGHWLTQEQVDRFNEILVKTLADPDIARKAGQYTPFSKAAGTISQYTMGFMTPWAAYTVLSKLYPHMSRGSTMETRSLGSCQVEVIAVQNPGVTERPYQCQNRMGVFEGIAKLFTGNLAAIEHDTCMHISGNRCVYRISWDEPPSLIWKRVSHYAYLACFIAGLLVAFSFPSGTGIIAILSMVLAAMGVSLYQAHLENNELTMTIRNHRTLADDLLEEINTRYNNTMLIQEIGQASSNILDIDELMSFVIETVKKRLNFDRGLIMLANQEETRLVYKVGYGYSPEEQALLQSAEFHLDNPRSKGPFVVAYKKQKPFLVNDIKAIENDISARTRDFISRLRVESFICVPIVYEGKSEGILAVDNHRLKRPLNQSDINLFLGIAPQIGISINNARSYQRIQEREERFRALSENAPDIIYTTDVTGALTYVNPAWERLLGHAREDVCGKYFTDFVKQDDVQQFRKLFKEIRDSRRDFSGIDGTILHKNGSERLFNMSGAANLDAEGNVIGAVGTFRDVTKQRMLENQLLHASKMEAVGTLTGGIAHDFNNIIQAVSGYNQLMMMKRDESDPDWKYLANIDRLHQRATDLIRQLLIFSRKVDINLQTVDLNREIKEYYNLLKQIIPRMISIDLHMETDLWKIKGDPAQLGQIFMNLSVNARDAMPEGGILEIRTENVVIEEKTAPDGMALTQGRYVLLHMSDTGHGMNQETLTHIFEPFYSTKEAGKGTGLGLAVVHGIVANHGGHISCESDPARGTTFRIYFPVPDESSSEAPAPVHGAAEEKVRSGEEMLLVVDDEESLLETTKILMEQYGYRVLTAESGETAIEIFKREKTKISLVILDLLMPGMGGLKCLDALLKIDPGVKVIISSGYMESSRQREVTAKGAAGFIQKPYRRPDILNLVRRVLDQGSH